MVRLTTLSRLPLMLAVWPMMMCERQSMPSFIHSINCHKSSKRTKKKMNKLLSDIHSAPRCQCCSFDGSSDVLIRRALSSARWVQCSWCGKRRVWVMTFMLWKIKCVIKFSCSRHNIVALKHLKEISHRIWVRLHSKLWTKCKKKRNSLNSMFTCARCVCFQFTRCDATRWRLACAACLLVCEMPLFLK